jgi:hypothetical protein
LLVDNRVIVLEVEILQMFLMIQEHLLVFFIQTCLLGLREHGLEA